MVLPLICSSSSLFYHCLQVAWKCRENASVHTFASCILEGSLAALLRFTHVQLAFVVAGAALCEPQSADFVAGTAFHTSAACIFEGSLVRNAFLNDSGCTKCYVFACEMLLRTSTGKLRGTTVAGRSRAVVGSVPPLWLEFSLVS